MGVNTRRTKLLQKYTEITDVAVAPSERIVTAIHTVLTARHYGGRPPTLEDDFLYHEAINVERSLL